MGHSEHFKEFLSNWYSLSRNNETIYRKITQEEPPAGIEQLTHPVVLYTFIYSKLGISLTDAEERELRDIYLRFDESSVASLKSMPSFGVIPVNRPGFCRHPEAS